MPDDALPAGFAPHLRTVNGGRIDWGTGFILAEGKGIAPRNTERDRLMAKRAAVVVATRNALLIANGIRIDADGRFSGIRNGRVQLRGVVQGRQILSTTWRPNRDPPECVVTVRVPLWGAAGIASLVHARQRRKAAAMRATRIALARGGSVDEDEILVIDARGLNLDPCMYPTVRDDRGAVLYDLAAMTVAGAVVRAPLQYVETSLKHEKLGASMSIRQHHALAVPNAIRPEPWIVDDGALLSGLSSPVFGFQRPKKTTSRPASRPTTRKTRRRRRVVRAIKSPTGRPQDIVLTKEDAAKLSKDPDAAALLRAGRVLIVVDSAAAGIQGRLDDRPTRTRFALLPPE